MNMTEKRLVVLARKLKWFERTLGCDFRSKNENERWYVTENQAKIFHKFIKAISKHNFNLALTRTKKVKYESIESFKEDCFYVKVRPCNEKYEGKTYFGVHLGEVSLGLSSHVNKDDKDVLVVSKSRYNPLIYIPETNSTVLGCGSFWGKINTKEELKEITNTDIDNIWYVKALKELS